MAFYRRKMNFAIDIFFFIVYYAIVDAVSVTQDADIAQVVERYIGNVEVTGPTPVISSFLLPSKKCFGTG